MSEELRSAVDDVMKIELQDQLEKAEREIHEWKERVNSWESKVNQDEGELKKEGEFTVFQSLTVSGYCTID